MHSCCGRVFAEEASFDAHQTKVHPHPYRIEISSNINQAAWRFERDLAEVIEIAKQFTGDQRKAAAKSGNAMPDGSFPINNAQDLKNAIRAVGRASNPAKAKAHIKKRANALGKSSLIPDDWATIGTGGVQGAPDVVVNPGADEQGLPYKCDYCGRRFASETAEKLHESLVHASQLPAGESQSGGSPKKTGDYNVPASKMTNDTSVSHAEDKKKNGEAQPSHLKDGKASNVSSSGGAGNGGGNSSANTTNPVTGAQDTSSDGGNGCGAGNSAAHDRRDVTQPQPTPSNDDKAESLWPWIISDQADKPESFDDIRGVVSDALDDLQHNINPLTGEKYYVWVADISDSWVVFSRRGDYFKVNYEMDDNGVVTFTGPVVSVSRRTVYVPDSDQDKDNTTNGLDDDDDDDADAAVATGHKKKKDGKDQPSHFKMGRAVYVLGIGPNRYDPDNDGDTDDPSKPDNDAVAPQLAS